MKKITITLLTFILIALTACEKADFTEQQKTNDGENLTLQVTNWRQVAYTATRGLVDISGYSSRLNFVLYKDGERVKSLSQMQDDQGYGQVSMKLQPGNYKVLVLAHSSKGNPTLTSPETIKFDNSISYSDTFYYYGDITVTTEPKTQSLTLQRASSLMRFVISDELPADLYRVQLLYTGGSGVFNAVTGYGANIDSRQEKVYRVDGYTAPLALPIYTFLQADEGKLNVTVTAKDKNDNVILERTFNNVPMKRNMVTEYTGTFFEHDNSFSFMADTEWADTIRVTY
jgi:hypothetical protein